MSTLEEKMETDNDYREMIVEMLNDLEHPDSFDDDFLKSCLEQIDSGKLLTDKQKLGLDNIYEFLVGVQGDL
jgi:hypothetical protein